MLLRMEEFRNKNSFYLMLLVVYYSLKIKFLNRPEEPKLIL